MSEDPTRSEADPTSIPDPPDGSGTDPLAPTEGEIPEDAIFSPDDPILINEVVEGVVTGMAGRSEIDTGAAGDLAWEIRHTANIMNALSKALKEQGMEALKLHPETEPMDAVLRSFVAGYLVGKAGLDE